MLRAIEAARRELVGAAIDDVRVRAVEDAATAIATLGRIPTKLASDAAELKTQAQVLWVRAHGTGHFTLFAPTLERTIEMQREMAGHIGYDEHPTTRSARRTSRA